MIYIPKRNKLNQEFFNLFCGDVCGMGGGRIVYLNRLDDSTVIKIHRATGVARQNLTEYESWCEVKGTPAEKWFAPVVECSFNGRILIQKKTVAVDHTKYPELIPPYLTDLKYQNFGWYEDRLVCHDYGINLLMKHGAMTKRLIKANWWTHNEET